MKPHRLNVETRPALSGPFRHRRRRPKAPAFTRLLILGAIGAGVFLTKWILEKP